MTISNNEAQALCTDVEFELFVASTANRVGNHSVKELNDYIDRARRARDKYQDLATRQARQQRGQQDPRGGQPADRNDRTQQKVQLFQEALDRFEAGLAEAQE